ncbi:MAG: T9SS type A sorting domain-containing protein [Bacteroidales bacterium]|nr:T9SS type A sorting domain-containing protein [Bacteroidales bacterium]
MKKTLLLFVFVAFSAIILNAQYLRGAFNSWGNTDLMELYYSHYNITIEVAEDTLGAGFKIDQYADWTLQWGYLPPESYNPIVNTSEGQMRGSNSGDSPNDFTKSFYAGKFYTFRLEGDETWWNRRFVIMETDAAPVELLAVSDNSLLQNENEVTVSITTSAELSPQETIYIRYTTDDWTSSFIVECSGTATNYQGVIPAQSAATVVEYYVFSSAMVLSFVTDNTDFSTLNANNNAGDNYTYTVISASAYAEASVSSDLIENTLNNAEINIEIFNDSFVDETVDPLNITLNNAPTGLTISNVIYVDANNITVVLGFDGTDFTDNITDFSITISADELAGTDALTTNNLTIYADIMHQDIYMCKVSMWEGAGDDTWYDEVDFNGHNFGSFNSGMSLYFKTGQVFTWQDASGEIVSAAMNYRIYKDEDTPGAFVNVDLPYFSEWISGINTDKLWWNDAPDEIDINLIDGAVDGTYFLEVYYEAETGGGATLYRNNAGANYIASFIITSDPILTATPTEALTEENLDGMEISLNVLDDYFVDAVLDVNNFTLNNAPVGLDISDVTYVDPNNATVTLSFDGTNFDVDITDFSISVAGIELNLGNALTSNSMTITAIDESITIHSHLLTSDNYQRYLGDNASYWINMEIGQLEWDGVQIGFGVIADNAAEWNWNNAEWYEDGEGDNKRVHSLITLANEIGSVYYAGRVRNSPQGSWFYANSADWSEDNALNAIYTIETMALPPATAVNAAVLDGTRINLNWTADLSFTNVMILAKETDAISTEPTQGVTYSVSETIDDAEVIYKGNAASFIHSGLINNTTYNYKIYTINNNYYSASIDATAATNDEEGCTFTLDLGEDINVCGGSSVLLNTNLVVKPYGDTLTIYFSTLDNADFAALDKIYMHAGVHLAGGTSWDYVSGNWGDDDGVGLMTQHDVNTWKITLNPLTYFGFPVESNLLGINLAFRNFDGTLTANNPDTGEDYFIDMSVMPPVGSHSNITNDFIQSHITDIIWSNGQTSSSVSVSEAGEYSVIVTDIYGCLAKDTINVGIHPLPYVELGDDQTVCSDTELILDAGEFEEYSWSNDSIGQTNTIIESGTYGVTVTDEFGCTGFDIVNIEFIDYPIAEFSYHFLSDLEVYFSDSSQNAVDYFWDFNGDDVIDSNTVGDVTYTFSEIGQFATSLTVSNQCSEDVYSQIIYVLDIETNEISNINIYPNPVAEILNIEFFETTSNIQIQLFSIDGKLIFDKKYAGTDVYSIDVSNYSAGIYNLVIGIDNIKSENKIVIK